ncbi:hypothetical protein ACV344_33270 [Pseudomonas aeruginosa]|uniref:hypothetical protein n=1 Tax=Pseudomonas aeruginosa TaxID=287 RepID=UPI000FFF1EF6|nr:hypothetical protein [Pseudomonas aeruginosa]MBA5107681.1 hypothetical protein [Pseudomonas aeruginosa]MBD1300120.1 hypothetical protein [Pseudomonas aeruginosa]MBD1340685.1 hypothetical protein [Pseudomonas aeruginosa]MBG4604272.1 hypothetical protein [Pseudomonas aeruginosa]MBH3592853.1 hypothetical protein [Pseudomonas aeruginosa]
MDFNRVIQAEADRAEALIAKYLGFYPGDLDLVELDVSSLEDVSVDFKRCVQMIQGLAEAAPSAIAAKNMVNLVDALADLVQVPRLRQPLMTLWEMEETLSSGGLWFVRHAVVIVLAFLGIGFVAPEMHGVPMAISYAALLTGYVSLALGLTHFKKPAAAFFVGFPFALVIGAALMVMANETLMMAALLLASIAMFIKSVVGMAMNRPDATQSFTDYDDDMSIENDRVIFPADATERFIEKSDPFLINRAGIVPYAADD